MSICQKILEALVNDAVVLKERQINPQNFSELKTI